MSDTRMKSPSIVLSPSSPQAQQCTPPSHSTESPIIYIMVVGFHHKLGCQLEFVYPENKLIKKNTTPATTATTAAVAAVAAGAKSNDIDLFTLPKRWAHLPSLALPDGSHNYNSDYIYFHLEDEDGTVEPQEDTADTSKQKNKGSKAKKLPNRTLFGISCYRQINASEMINKDSNVTRNTLQKSVCILSTCPLYATSIRLKLHSITCAYFDQKDFRRTQILIDAFNTTFRNSSAFSDYSINYKKSADENLIGLSLSDLVVRYQHRILVLFKLVLLQKKCLFQLKPVSNLSNTIISLISLIPDIFHPADCDSSDKGLEYCSGFFDSIDLVNSELERKANAKSKALLATRNGGYSKSTAALNSSVGKKVKKKRMLSFSSKTKKSASNQLSSAGSLSSSSSPMSSMSSSPVTVSNGNGTNLQQQQLSQISSDCQRLYESTLNASSSSHDASTSSSNGTAASERASNQSKENNNPLNWSGCDADNKIDTQAATQLTKSTSHIISTPQQTTTRSHLRLSLKKKKKPTTTTTQQAQLDFSGNSSHSSTATTTVVPESPTTNINGNNNNNNKQLQLEELLGIDFGMPLNLFSQFNILHPYLSLYYLEYFTGINKMNTKLYCTTSLMLSMMSAANNPEAEPEAATVEPSEDINSNSSSMASSSGCSSYTNPTPRTSSHRPGGHDNQQNLAIGYTIGATNALFKQRLYDDIDVFVDEATIDLKQNEVLKKQLQLSTADLRFADYLLKHVNASRSSQQKAMSNQSSSNTPTLLSVKKTSNSFSSEADDASMANPSLLSSSNWEGSDEWIRLNFKWYFYTLLGSMVKEELCAEARSEAELLVNQLAGMEASLQRQQEATHEYSSCSSSISLANEVVDIDDYIERASVKSSNPQSSTKMSSSKYSSYSLNPGSEQKNAKKSQNRRDSDSNSQDTNNTSLLLSQQAQSYLGSSGGCAVAYQEDFNASYIGEFRRTECFQDWCEKNRKRLEHSLFKLDEFATGEDCIQDRQINTGLQLELEPATQADLALVTSKLQATLKKLQHLESVKVNHPFSGTMGVHDIKLRFNFLFTTTDSGKKINKALAEGSKIMNTTGRAVGDALSQAKSSFSSLWSNWSSPNSSTNSSRNHKSASQNTSRDNNNQKFTNLS